MGATVLGELEKLINQCCPDGVEYRTLGDIAIDVYRGSGIRRDQISENGIPCLRYGEIYTTYGIWFDKCVSHVNPDDVESKKYFDHGDVLFAITGESVEDIAKSTVYMGNERCLAGGDVVVLKHNQNPKYLGYVLSSRKSVEQKRKGKVKSKVVHSSVPDIKSIVIPLPPLEVQEEIVRILDSFLEYTKKLTLELTAELNARQRQYEYYRDQLLSFDHLTLEERERCGVKWMSLSSIAGIYDGIHQTPNYVDGGIRFVSVEDIDSLYSSSKYISEEDYRRDYKHPAKKGDLFMTRIGSIGKCSILTEDEELAYYVTLTLIRPNESIVSSKYLKHIIESKTGKKELKKRTLVSAIPIKINLGDVGKIVLPIPSLEVQNELTSLLDRYYLATMSLANILSDDLTFSYKLYECYRDMIFSFKRRDSCGSK